MFNYATTGYIVRIADARQNHNTDLPSRPAWGQLQTCETGKVLAPNTLDQSGKLQRGKAWVALFRVVNWTALPASRIATQLDRALSVFGRSSSRALRLGSHYEIQSLSLRASLPPH